MAIGWACSFSNPKSPRPWAQKRPLMAIGWACCSPNPMSSRQGDHAEVRSARISESFRWYQLFGAAYFSGTSQMGDFGMNCPARWLYRSRLFSLQAKGGARLGDGKDGLQTNWWGGFRSGTATGASQVPRRHPNLALQAWHGPSPKFSGTSNAWIFEMAWQQENCWRGTFASFGTLTGWRLLVLCYWDLSTPAASAEARLPSHSFRGGALWHFRSNDKGSKWSYPNVQGKLLQISAASGEWPPHMACSMLVQNVDTKLETMKS